MNNKQDTKKMLKERQELAPKLRFPEFRGERAWLKTTIGELGSFYYGKSAPKWSLEEKAPTECVRYGELYTKFGAVITETFSRTNIDPSNLRFSKGGEILVPRVGEKPEDFGKCCCYLPLANIAIGEMISVFETAQNPLFYTYYFRKMYKQFANVVEGQNVKNLYYVQLEPLAIGLPSLPEQKKIANCLYSLDELITLEAQKLEALKSHKKGLMQQLFPAEGETLPKLRFPEFRDAWKKCKLESHIDLLSGYAFKSEFFSKTGNKILTPKNFTKNGRANFNIENTKYTSEDFDQKYICKEGDLLLLLTDLTPSCELLGKPILLTKEDGEVLLNQRIVRVIPKGEINIHFLLYLFSTENYHKRIKNTAAGSTVRHSSNKIIAGTKIFFPSLKEQQKITDCLSSIDELITLEAQKLETLKSHKKGLIQQLFPVMDEI